VRHRGFGKVGATLFRGGWDAVGEAEAALLGGPGLVGGVGLEGVDGVLGEAGGAAAVDLGEEASSFSFVGVFLGAVLALLAGVGWALAVLDELLHEGFVGLVTGDELGDGGEWAEVGIEGEVVDGDGAVVFLFGGPGFEGGLFREVGGGDLEGVEDEAGAAGIDGVGGDAGDDVVEGDLDGGAVLDEGDGDGFEAGVAGGRLVAAAVAGVVVEAEGLAAEGDGAAAEAVDADVAALEAAGFGLGFRRFSGRFSWWDTPWV
jgi:hypothetical protein